jgi:hypothetical protein
VSNLEEQLGAEAQERMIAAKNNRKPFSPGSDTDPDPCFAIKIKVVFLTFF